MITLNYDLDTGIAKLAQTTAIKLGADVPVRLVFSRPPNLVSDLELALAAPDAAAGVLAFTDDFSAESDRVWVTLLDANDTRLAEFMEGESLAQVNVELAAVIDGARRIAPNIPVSVQRAALNGPTSPSTGPDYYTSEEVDAAIAAALLAGLNAGADYDAAALSSTGTTTPAIAATARSYDLLLQPGAGAESYTRTIVLATANRQTRDKVHVRLEMPASGNPSIDFRDSTVGGTQLLGGLIAGDAESAHVFLLTFRFNGSSWAKWSVAAES